MILNVSASKEFIEKLRPLSLSERARLIGDEASRNLEKMARDSTAARSERSGSASGW